MGAVKKLQSQKQVFLLGFVQNRYYLPDLLVKGLGTDFVVDWLSQGRGGELAVAVPRRKFCQRRGVFVVGCGVRYGLLYYCCGSVVP